MITGEIEVSVLIPVFNTRKYIIRCLESILTQDIENLELIVIDDCSTDGTYEILVEMASKHPEVRLYRNEMNSGAGYTKNRALSYARGDYICFVDSDDWLLEGSLKYLNNLANQTNADDIFYNSISICEGKAETAPKHCRITENEKCFYRGMDLLESLLEQGKLIVGAVHHFFGRDKLREDVRFSEKTVNDDWIFSTNLMLSLGKTIYTNHIFYVYFRREKGSVTNLCNSKSMICELFQQGVTFIEQHFDVNSADERRIREKCFENLMIEVHSEKERKKENSIEEYDYIRNKICQNEKWKQLFISSMKKSTYGIIDEKELERIKDFERIYIYGAGAVGCDMGHVIKGYGLPLSGYIVTKKDAIRTENVWSIDEIDVRTQPAIVIGVSKMYQNEVRDELGKRGFQNIFDLLIR